MLCLKCSVNTAVEDVRIRDAAAFGVTEEDQSDSEGGVWLESVRKPETQGRCVCVYTTTPSCFPNVFRRKHTIACIPLSQSLSISQGYSMINVFSITE